MSIRDLPVGLPGALTHNLTKKPQTFSSGGASSGFITEPYGYREYFDAQGYIPSRATIYSDSETPTTSYEGRFATAHSKNASIYAKPVTSAAGLTVDLPSPDSGIGTDAITPRDQNNIQQVNKKLFSAKAIGALTQAYTHSAHFVSPLLSSSSSSLHVISINNFCANHFSFTHLTSAESRFSEFRFC